MKKVLVVLASLVAFLSFFGPPVLASLQAWLTQPPDYLILPAAASDQCAEMRIYHVRTYSHGLTQEASLAPDAKIWQKTDTSPVTYGGGQDRNNYRCFLFAQVPPAPGDSTPSGSLSVARVFYRVGEDGKLELLVLWNTLGYVLDRKNIFAGTASQLLTRLSQIQR